MSAPDRDDGGRATGCGHEAGILVERYLEGDITEEESRALAAALGRDPRLADEIFSLLALDEGLRELFSPEGSPERLAAAVRERLRAAGSSAVFAARVTSRLRAEALAARGRVGSRPLWALWAAGLAAAAAALVAVVLTRSPADRRRSGPTPDRIARNAATSVAPAADGAQARGLDARQTSPGPAVSSAKEPSQLAPPHSESERPAAVPSPAPEPTEVAGLAPPAIGGPGTPGAPAPESGHVAYLDAAAGIVERRAGPSGRGWVPVQTGAALSAGDAVRTHFSRARVRFESGSVLHINRFTSVAFVAAAPPAVSMTGGELYVETVPADRGFTVETPHGLVRDLGTRFGVDSGPLGTTVCVLEGKAEISTEAGRTEILAGQEAVLARRTSPPGPAKDSRDAESRFAWAREKGPQTRSAVRLVYLTEDFEDPQLVIARWWTVPGRFSAKTSGRLEIDPSRAINSGQPGWIGPGGIQSRDAYPLPLRVSVDVEMTHGHRDLIAALLFMPQGVRADSEKGDVFRVELRGDTYGLAVQASRYIREVQVPGPWPRRERWTVDVAGDEVRFSAGDREVLRAAHGRGVHRAYHIRPECNAMATAPADSRVRFDNMVVEALGAAGAVRETGRARAGE